MPRRSPALAVPLRLGLLLLAAAVPFGAAADSLSWTQRIHPGPRPVQTAIDGMRRGDLLTVVIEGDGAGFDARGRPTSDPTPRRYRGLDLAKAWPGPGPVAWVGRLCHEVHDPACSPADWTGARYSRAALDSASSAIDALKRETGASQVRLVGWSGGGVIATLLAQQRDDVEGLITFASPLDTRAWTRGLGLTPLAGSLNPSDQAIGKSIPQVHMLGRFDRKVPAALMEGPLRSAMGGAVLVRRQNHECCWTREIETALSALAKEAAAAPASAVAPAR